MKHRLIIAGGRDFKDEKLVDETLASGMLNNHVHEHHLTVLCGMAKGADKLGKNWAEKRNIPVQKFYAIWHIHGKAAGPIRNREMAENADSLIAFWDGKSSGTKNMIEEAKKLNLSIKVVPYNQNEENQVQEQAKGDIQVQPGENGG